jgi:hypothetical protein
MLKLPTLLLAGIILLSVPLEGISQQKVPAHIDKRKISKWLRESSFLVPLDSVPPFMKNDPTWQNKIPVSAINQPVKKVRVSLADILEFIRHAGNIYEFSLRPFPGPEDSTFCAEEDAIRISHYLLACSGRYGNTSLPGLYSRINSLDQVHSTRRIKIIAPGWIFEYDFYKRNGQLIEHKRTFSTGTKSSTGDLSVESTRYFDIPAGAVSITIRRYIDIPQDMKKASPSALEETASQFLEKYFQKLYQLKATLTSTSPPTIYLEHVRGYVTSDRKFWENVQVKLDNIQYVDDKLLIQCSIDGQYVKLNTPYITDDAFDNSYILEKDYSPEMNGLGLNIINEFDKFLKTKPCLRTH